MAWSIIEPAMYLIAACLLTLRPLFRRILQTNLKSRLQNSMVFRKSQNSGSNDYHGTRRRYNRPLRDSFIELHQGRDAHSAGEDVARPAPIAPKKLAIPRHDVERGQAVDLDSNLAVLDA